MTNAAGQAQALLRLARATGAERRYSAAEAEKLATEVYKEALVSQLLKRFAQVPVKALRWTMALDNPGAFLPNLGYAAGRATRAAVGVPFKAVAAVTPGAPLKGFLRRELEDVAGVVEEGAQGLINPKNLDVTLGGALFLPYAAGRVGDDMAMTQALGQVVRPRQPGPSLFTRRG